MVIASLLDNRNERAGMYRVFASTKFAMSNLLKNADVKNLGILNRDSFSNKYLHTKVFKFSLNNNDFPSYLEPGDHTTILITVEGRGQDKGVVRVNDNLCMKVSLGGSEIVYILEQRAEDSVKRMFDHEGKMTLEQNFNTQVGDEISGLIDWLNAR